MTDRFIKLMDSEKSLWLLIQYPNAFLLLTYIAMHARREPGHPDGLIPGDAILGNPKACGLTRQQYRTAIIQLVEFGFIDIITNGKKFFEPHLNRKSTIRLTIKGYLVNLKDTSIYDINAVTGNQQTNQQPTNSQPTANHKQERIRKNKNEKEESTPTPSFSETVSIYPCVEEMKISFEEKQNISRNLTEAQAKIGIAWATRPGFKPSSFVGYVISIGKSTANYPPEFKKKPTTFEELKEHFRHGAKYNGAECFVTEKAIAFARGMNHHQLEINQYFSWNNLTQMCDRFGISFTRGKRVKEDKIFRMEDLDRKEC